MNEAHSYFTATVVTCICELCTSGSTSVPVVNSNPSLFPGQDEACEDYDASHLLSLAVQVTLAYVGIAMQQFEGFVAHSSRQVHLQTGYVL